jgi:YidC/Oxa1 family membrane protein insertase
LNLNTDPNKKPSFMDRSTLIAFMLILGFWFAWSKYMQQAYPPATPTETSATEAASPTKDGAAPTVPATAPVAGTNPGVETKNAPAIAASTEEKFVDFADENWAFQISSKGMGLRNIDVKTYQTRKNEPIVLAKLSNDYPFSTSVLGSTAPIDFTIEQKDPTTFVGRANVGGMQIEKTMKVNSSLYTVDVSVNVSQTTPDFKGLTTTLADTLLVQPPSGGMFSFLGSETPVDHQVWYVNHEGSNKREAIIKEKGVTVDIANVTIAALTEHYFALGVVDRSETVPRFDSRVPVGADKAVGQLVYQPAVRAENFAQKYVGFAGPKSYSTLVQTDDTLTKVIDYGMFAFFAKPILWLLKYLFTLIGNWGVAIIVLTIIVRLIVMPFNIYSYKSMKVMQRIQPEMNRIRERYKDKPADQKMQMNQEVMELMKRNNANPIGGCLPMLIQLPVFIALYSVLGQSIELYRAPFMLWIHDLSVRDPFFVLPILMGITMFVNQKITPTNMDPQQAKIMMWMPVIFSLFMLSLPSGLTLYIFISTLFGILQQMFFMRDKGTVQSTNAAKA